MLRHPGGRSTAFKRVLDAIGCGNYSPIMAKATRLSMLRQGLIECCGIKAIGRGPIQVIVMQYQMPIPVYRAWCDFQAQEYDREKTT